MRPVVLRARAMPVMTRAQAADAAARQQHETLGGLIAQLRQLERDVGSEAYVVYYTSRADAACLVLQGPAKFYSPYRPPYVAVLEQRRTIDDHHHAFAPPLRRPHVPPPNAVVVNGGSLAL